MKSFIMYISAMCGASTVVDGIESFHDTDNEGDVDNNRNPPDSTDVNDIFQKLLFLGQKLTITHHVNVIPE